MSIDKQQHKEEKVALLQQALSPKTVLKSGLREYKVVEVLGAGGFGITYKVVADIQVGNVTISSYFVIKEHFLKGCWRGEDKMSVLHAPTLEADIKTTRKDFINEAKRLNKLGQKTPNIVKVNEVFEANGTAYYVMEYLDGGNFLQYVSRYGPLPEEDAIRLIVIVAKAVALLHERNLLHLDIKPDNIVLKTDAKTGRQLPVLIDFGIAKHFDKHGKPTSHLVAKGASEGYAPMEQYDEITHFASEIDVYALGATLYFLLTGKHPPKAFNIHSFRDLQDNLPSGISTQTVNALASAMKPSKYERTQTVSAFLRDLNGEHITGHDTEIFTRKREKMDTHLPPRLIPKERLLIFAGVACAVVLFVWIGRLFFSPVNSDSESTPPAENVVKTEVPEVQIEQTPTVDMPSGKDVEKDSKTSDVATPSVAEERKQHETKKETTGTSTPKATKKVEVEPRKEETNAQKCDKAVATRDIVALKKLAGKGYAPAYSKLATLYLDNREYSLADTYAQKAYDIYGKLRFSIEKLEALKVMERLDALGYYDDKERPKSLEINSKAPKFAWFSLELRAQPAVACNLMADSGQRNLILGKFLI